MPNFQLHGQKSVSIKKLLPKRRLVLSCEGEVTEPEYFKALNSMLTDAVFEIVENDGSGSDPDHVIKRMESHLGKNPFAKNDNNEAWLVIDEDKWTKEQIQKCKDWESKDTRYHLAISIKRFEDWLKLHVNGDMDAQKMYKELLTADNKHVPSDFVTKKRVEKAIDLAKKMKSVGNVYQIIEPFFRKK